MNDDEIDKLAREAYYLAGNAIVELHRANDAGYTADNSGVLPWEHAGPELQKMWRDSVQ